MFGARLLRLKGYLRFVLDQEDGLLSALRNCLEPGGLPRRARGEDPVPQNGISSSRSTSSGFSFSADFGRLRKSTFSAMISQP